MPALATVSTRFAAHMPQTPLAPLVPRLQQRLIRLARLVATTAVFALAAAGGARAQSLQELYEAARAFDATYLASKALADSARYRLERIEALGKPTLSATAGASVGYNDTPTTNAGDIQSISGALRGRYPLINRANTVTIEQAKRSLDSAAADLETAEQDLIVRVALAYFDVLAAQDTLGTTRASKAAITEQLASAKRNFEVGTATITDTREAQARFDLATAQEIAADNDLRAKRIALDTLVGRTGVEPKPLAVPVALPPVAPLGVEEWVTVADERHPTVKRAKVSLEVARLETEKARAGDKPTLDAVATLSNSSARGSSLPPVTRGNSTSATVGVELNWPLYTGGATQAAIRENLLLEQKASNDLQAARRGVAQSTRVAFFGVQSGQAQVLALEAAEASSKLALEATQLGYRVGVRVNLDVLNAQTQLYTTQRDLARARYDVIVGGLRLRQASGQLAGGDVESVNRLLTR